MSVWPEDPAMRRLAAQLRIAEINEILERLHVELVTTVSVFRRVELLQIEVSLRFERECLLKLMNERTNDDDHDE